MRQKQWNWQIIKESWLSVTSGCWNKRYRNKSVWRQLNVEFSSENVKWFKAGWYFRPGKKRCECIMNREWGKVNFKKQGDKWRLGKLRSRPFCMNIRKWRRKMKSKNESVKTRRRKKKEKTFENLMKERIKRKMRDKWRNGKMIMQLNFNIKKR